jgi:hypothetical protein
MPAIVLFEVLVGIFPLQSMLSTAAVILDLDERCTASVSRECFCIHFLMLADRHEESITI